MQKMPKIIKGDVQYSDSRDYSQVQEIGGYLDCWSAKEVNLPKLTTIGGYLDCESAKEVNLPKLTTIGGSLDCRSAKVNLPKLREKGCGDAKAMAKVRLAFQRKGFVLFDGILASILSTKDRVYGSLHRIKLIGQTEVSFCIEAEGSFSHGKTVKEARESLIYKIGNRDKSAYEKWTLDMVITRKQAIESYRVITGACESGCRQFEATHGKLKSRLKVSEVVAATKGQYGNDQYREFFCKLTTDNNANREGHTRSASTKISGTE